MQASSLRACVSKDEGGPRTHRVAQIPHRCAVRNFSLRRLDSACVLCYVRRIPAR